MKKRNRTKAIYSKELLPLEKSDKNLTHDLGTSYLQISGRSLGTQQY